MEAQQIIALVTFAFVSTITPGPNNIMLMASGANVGFRRTIPHVFGIVFGFSLMIVLVGLGLIEVFNRYPLTHNILQVSCIGYLLYLTIRIALSKQEQNQKFDYKPMSFWAAANFQWVNPKAWSMALSAISVYNISDSWQGVIIVSLIFAAINIPAASVWALVGERCQLLLSSQSNTKYFNYGMAALLLVSTLMMV